MSSLTRDSLNRGHKKAHSPQALSFVDYYDRNFSRLVAAIELGGCSRQEAEDAVQEAFARSYERWAHIAQGVNPTGYVYRVASRLQERRRRRDDAWRSLASDTRPASREDDPSGTAVNSVIIQTLLSSLPPRQRKCVVLCAVFEWSSAEAAAFLGVDSGTVRSQVHDARQRLKRALSELDL